MVPGRFNSLVVLIYPTNSAPTWLIFLNPLPIHLGGNDLRDVMVGAVAPEEIPAMLGNIGGAVTTLYLQGARQFLVVNVADFGQVPSVQILDQILPQIGFPAIANALALGFNQGLVQLQAVLINLPGIDIRIFDLYTLFETILAAPGDYGLEVTDRPCLTPNIPPYVCKKPNEYLFWDGLHATKAVHQIMASKAAELLMEP